MAKLVAPPTDSSLLDSSMDQSSLYDSSMGSSSLGQSMGGGGERGRERVGEREGEEDTPMPHDAVLVQRSPVGLTSELQGQQLLSGPPIQIIPDYRVREGGAVVDGDEPSMEFGEAVEEEKVDAAFMSLLEDAGIGDSCTGTGMYITMDEIVDFDRVGCPCTCTCIIIHNVHIHVHVCTITVCTCIICT